MLGEYHPTRRKPQKRDARQVYRPNAHPRKQVTDYHRAATHHITLLDVLSAFAVVLFVVAFVWALGVSYQVGYQAGLGLAAS